MVVIYQKGLPGQDDNLWFGEMSDELFRQLDASEEELKRFLVEQGVEFDADLPIELVELIPEVAAEMGL